MRGEAKGIDVHLLMMECYQRLGWKKYDLYPGCCGCGGGCCWRPKYQILPPTEIDVEGNVGRRPRMSRKLGSFF